MTPNEKALAQFEEFINDTSDEEQLVERQSHSSYLIRTNALGAIMNCIMLHEYAEAYMRAQDLHQFEEEMNNKDLDS